MGQPNTAEENNNLPYIGISIALLALVAIVGYCFFGRGEEEAKTSTKPTTAHVALHENVETGKKGGKVETNSKERVLQGKATYYVSKWGALGAFAVTTVMLACYNKGDVDEPHAKKLPLTSPNSWQTLKAAVRLMLGNEIVPILSKTLCTGLFLMGSRWVMGTKENILKDLCSGQNLVKNTGTIFLSLVVSCTLFFTCEVRKSPSNLPTTKKEEVLKLILADTLAETLFMLILTWLVHDGIQYLLSHRLPNPSAPPKPKVYADSSSKEDNQATSANPATEDARQREDVEAGKKAVQGEGSTSYGSLWGLLGGVGVTTFTLAYWKLGSSYIVPIIGKVLCAGVVLMIGTWHMNIEDNILTGISSGQNLWTNLQTILLPFVTSWIVFLAGKICALPLESELSSYLSALGEALVETLITVILAWLVHDVIKYLLNDRAAKPSSKPTLKGYAGSSSKEKNQATSTNPATEDAA